MAVYNVVGYYNTGFGAGNVPDSPSVVQLATSKTFPSNWLLQDRDLATTRLNAGWADVQNIDYVRIGSVYYFVTGVRMLTEVCAELALQIDPLTTAGGISALDITDGWCTRAHAASDELFSNILDEPWNPTQELQIWGKDTFVKGSGKGEALISSTVSLLLVENVATEYFDELNNAVCYVPKVPAVSDPTTCVMQLPGWGRREQVLPATQLFYNEDFKDVVQQVRSLGLSDAITGCYVLPYEWGTFTVSLNVAQGVNYTKDFTTLPFNYVSVQNKKVLALFNTYTLLSIASGDAKTFDAHDIYVSGMSSPRFVFYSDPAPNGRPFGQPAYFQSSPTLPFQQSVKGGQWLNQPIVYSQAEGAGVLKQQFENQQSINRTAAVLGATPAGVNTGFSASTQADGGVKVDGAGIVSAVLGYGTNSVVSGLNEMQQQREFSTVQNIRVPEVTFAYTPSVQGYVGNGFVVVHTGLSAADAQRLDRFFTMFGYAQSKQLVKSDFTNRRYFNYVQADNVGVRGNVGLRIREGVTRMLSGGVRIWHTLPNSSYYSSNPIG